MKHEVIALGPLCISCPELLLNALFLKRLPTLTAMIPYSQISFEHSEHGVSDHSDLHVCLEERCDDEFISECIGDLSFRPYVPKIASSGWIAAHGMEHTSPIAKLETRAFSTPPTFSIPSLTARISAMKSTGMASVLPDTIAGMDPSLIAYDDPNLIESSRVWLCIRKKALDSPQIQMSVDWMKACVEQNSWLNTSATNNTTLALT